jgi:tripartite-type tricarboxylate transporter receptor subunit TctC
MIRRPALLALCAAVLLVPAARSASAQEWPAKPVRWVVPYAAGGYGDLRARTIGKALAVALGQPITVENKPGAGGVVGTDFVAKSAPDGYTIGMGNLAPLAVNVSLMKKLPYDPARDLQPVILFERTPLILTAGPGLDARTLAEVIAKAKAQPGKIGFGSSGIGGAHHLSGEMLRQRAGIDIVHVPYKGGGPAASDLLAGHLPMMFEAGYAALPSIKAGKIKAIAVTSSRRLPSLPETPTMSEAGLAGFESYNWQGLVVPAGTPRPIVDRLNAALNQILAQADQRDAIVATASEPAGGTPEAFRDFIAAERAKWAQVIREAKIQPE